MKRIVLLTLLIIIMLVGCKNPSVENYDTGIKALNTGNYDEAISYLKLSNNENTQDIINDIELHKMVLSYYENTEYRKAQEKAMLIKDSYPLYEEVKAILDKLTSLVEKENIIIAEQKLEQAKAAFSKQEYILAYSYLKGAIELQPEHNETLQLSDIYKAKSDEEIEKAVIKKEQAKAESNNTSAVTSDNKKLEFEKMILKALTGLASKAYFNSENDFIIEVDSSEWDDLSENEQKDILYLLAEYIDVLNEDLGDSLVSGFGAIFSTAGRQLKSF